MTWFNSMWQSWVGGPDESSYEEEQRRLEEDRRRQERQAMLLEEQEKQIQEQYFGKKATKEKAKSFEGTSFLESFNMMDQSKSETDNMSMISGWARQEMKKKSDMEGGGAGGAKAAAGKAEDDAAKAQKEGSEDIQEAKADSSKAGNDDKKKKMQKKKGNQGDKDNAKNSDSKLSGNMGNESKMQMVALNTMAAVNFDPNNPLANQIMSKQQMQQAKMRNAAAKRNQAASHNDQAKGKKKEVSTLFKQSTKIHKMARQIGQKAAMGLMVVKMGINRINGQMAMLKMKEVKADVTVKKGQLTQVKGQTTQAEGVVTQGVGKAIQVAGKALAAVGRVLISIGQALCSNPFTASAGAALIAMGTKLQVKGDAILQPKGMATESKGTATEASGKATETSGKATEKSGQLQKKQIQMQKKRLELQKKQLERMKQGLEKLKKMADKLKNVAQKIRLAALAMMGKAAAIVAMAVTVAQEALGSQAEAGAANTESMGLADQGKEMMKSMKLDYQISDNGEMSLGMSGGAGDKKMGLYMGENGRMAGSFSNDDMSINAQKDKNGWGVGGGMNYDNDGDGSSDGTFGFNAGSNGFGMSGSQIDDDGSSTSWGLDTSGAMSYGETDVEGNAYNVAMTGDGELSYEGQSVEKDSNGNITAIDRYGVNSSGDIHMAEQTRKYETYTDENGNKYVYLKSVDEVGFQKQDGNFGGMMADSNYDEQGNLLNTSSMAANSDGSFNMTDRENTYQTYTDESGQSYKVLSQSDASSVGRTADGVLGFASEQQKYNDKGNLLTDDRMGMNTAGDGYLSNTTNQYYGDGSTLKNSESNGISKFGDIITGSHSETDFNQFGQMTKHEDMSANNHGDFNYNSRENDYNLVQDQAGNVYSNLTHSEGFGIENANGVMSVAGDEQYYDKNGNLLSSTAAGINSLGDGYLASEVYQYDEDGQMIQADSSSFEKSGDKIGMEATQAKWNEFGQLTDKSSMGVNNKGDFHLTDVHNDYNKQTDQFGNRYSTLSSSEGTDIRNANGVLGFDHYDQKYNDKGNLLTDDRMGANTKGDGYLTSTENQYYGNGSTLKHSESNGIMKQGDKITGAHSETDFNRFGQMTKHEDMSANTDGDFAYNSRENDYNLVRDPASGQVYSQLTHSEGVGIENANGVLSAGQDEQYYDKNGNLLSSTAAGINSLGDAYASSDVYQYDANGQMIQADSTKFEKDGDKLSLNTDQTKWNKFGQVTDKTSYGVDSTGDFHLTEQHNQYNTYTDPNGGQYSVIGSSSGTDLRNVDGVLSVDAYDQKYNERGQLLTDDRLMANSKGDAGLLSKTNAYDSNYQLRDSNTMGVRKSGDTLSYEQTDGHWDKDGDLINRSALGVNNHGDAHVNNEDRLYETVTDQFGNQRKVLRYRNEANLDVQDGKDVSLNGNEQSYNRRGQLTETNELGIDTKGNAQFNGVDHTYDANGVRRHTEMVSGKTANGEMSYEQANMDFNARGRLTDDNRLGMNSNGDAFAYNKHNDYQADGRTLAHTDEDSFKAIGGNISVDTMNADYNRRGQLTHRDTVGMDSNLNAYATNRDIKYYENGMVADNTGSAFNLNDGVMSASEDKTLYDRRGQMRYHDDAAINSEGAISMNQSVINPTGLSSRTSLNKDAGSDNIRTSEQNILRDQYGRVQKFDSHDVDSKGYEKTVSGDALGNLNIRERDGGREIYNRTRDVDPRTGQVNDITLQDNGNFNIDNYSLNPNDPRREQITGIGGETIFNSFLPGVGNARRGPSAEELAAPYSHQPEMWDTPNLTGHYNIHQPEILANSSNKSANSDLQEDLEKLLKELE